MNRLINILSIPAYVSFLPLRKFLNPILEKCLVFLVDSSLSLKPIFGFFERSVPVTC